MGAGQSGMSNAVGTVRGSGGLFAQLPRGFHAVWGTLLFAGAVITGLLLHEIEMERERLIDGYRSSARTSHASLLSGIEDQLSRLRLLMALARDQQIDWSALIAQDSEIASRRSALPANDGPGGGLADQKDRSLLRAVLLLDGSADSARQYGLPLTPTQVEALARACSALSRTSAPETDPTLFLLDPLHLDQEGHWLLPLGQIRSRKGGCHADLALLDTDYLNRMLDRLDIDFAAISTANGIIVARHPDARGTTGQRWTDALDIWRYQGQAAQSGLVTSPLDGKVRIAAFGAAATLPVHIVLGYDLTRVDTVIGDHRRTVSLGAAIAGLALLFAMAYSGRLMLDQIGRAASLLDNVDESRRRMQLALETTEQGIWEWLPTSGDLYLSDEWRDLLGFGRQGEPVTFDAWLARVHPDDRTRVMQALHDCLRGRSDDFRQRYRLRMPGRGWRWVRCSGTTLERDPQDQAIRITGTIRDVTDEEEARIESGIAGLVFEQAAEGIAITDAQNRFIQFNQAFCDMTGYSQQELLGRHPSMLSAGLQDKSHFQEMWTSLQVRGSWRGEIWNRRKSGEFHAEWLSIAALRDEAGQPIRYVAIYSDITDQKRKEELAERQAYFDPLTNLPNRRLFFDRLEQEIQVSSRDGQTFNLLFVDLDNFKEVNRRHGHAFGDRVLIEVARRLMGCCRASDTVARIGGDEFVILARHGDLPQAEVMAGKVLSALRDPVFPEQFEGPLSVSIGVSSFPVNGQSLQEMMQSAVDALNLAKEGGSRRTSFYSRDREEETRRRVELTTALQLAMRAGALDLDVQAIHDIVTRRPIKAEVLLRWIHKERQIPPSQFIPLAEDSDLICDLGDWVFGQIVSVLEDIQAHESLAEGFSFALNQSARQLELRDTPAVWLRRLQAAGLAPSRLMLELPPKLFSREYPRANQRLRTFVAAGIGLSMDDFGTGHATPDALRSLPVREIKIDRSLIARLEDNADTRRVVESMIDTARAQGIATVAEGVETEGQLAILGNMGCDMAQGFLLSQPKPMPQFLKEMRARGVISPRTR